MQQDIDHGLLTNDSYLYEFYESDGKKGILTGKIALALLRTFIESIDYAAFGLTPKQIGLHSL
jgi:pyruvate-formate lyase